VKIRVTANPNPKAARHPHIFAAGSTFNEPQAIQLGLKPPPPLPRPRRSPREALDWRICGDQDPQWEGVNS